MSKTICFCASANFYEHLNQLADAAEQMGYTPVVPEMAGQMKADGDYNAESRRTWLTDPTQFDYKKRLMDAHFEKIKTSDMVLVVNDEKKGISGYVGTNVLMEMAIAYFLGKPIYLVNDVGSDHPAYEEIVGMGVVMLHGDVSNLPTVEQV